MAIRGAAPVTERALFVLYPFLPGAEALVAGVAPSVRDLVSEPALERAREIARARVRSATDDPTGAAGVAELVHARDEERLVSFLYARLLLSVAPTSAPLRRWAVAEAKLASGRLSRAPIEELADVAHRLGYQLDPDGVELEVDLPDYLRLSAPIREADFRLARQRLAGGRVRVGRERGARLLQEGIRGRLAVPLAVAEDLRSELLRRESEFLAVIVERVPAPAARSGAGVAPLHPEWFPPCIRKMRRVLESGENLSHAGRFALAAFLNRVGASRETIVDAYRGAPDFDEGVTRYQVEHITLKEDGFGYEPPECAKLRSHGLCFRDGDPTARSPVDRARDPRCFEPSLRHPLQYYERRGGGVLRRERSK